MDTKKDLSSLPATSAEAEKDRAPELGVASGWPGLIPWLGEGFFRTLAYSMFVLAGVAIAHHESFIGIVGALVLGHFSICTAEVIDQMEREKQDEDSSANTLI